MSVHGLNIASPKVIELLQRKATYTRIAYTYVRVGFLLELDQCRAFLRRFSLNAEGARLVDCADMTSINSRRARRARLLTPVDSNDDAFLNSLDWV